VGVELSHIAIEQLFSELGATPDITQVDNFKRYRAPNIDIFVGDIFNLTEGLVASPDAVYDRAALVALPLAMRRQYTSHVKAITRCAKQLLICFEYDQNQLAGPPFSIDEDEVKMHYAKDYNFRLLESREVQGKLKGQCPAAENVWLLDKKA
jgi:thiopurine S-methyltransferase